MKQRWSSSTLAALPRAKTLVLPEVLGCRFSRKRRSSRGDRSGVFSFHSWDSGCSLRGYLGDPQVQADL